MKKLTNKKKNERLIKAVTELRLCALSGYMPDKKTDVKR